MNQILTKLTCSHGETSSDCNWCLLESSKDEPMWHKITTLQQRSRVQIEKIQKGCIFEVDEHTFTIKTIRNSQDESVDKMLDLLEETFSEGQVPDREIFRKKIEGLTPLGTERPRYRCFYIENEYGEIVAVRVAEQIPLKNKDGQLTDKTMFYGIYIVVKEEYRNTGIGRDLYIYALIDALIDAKRNNKSIDLIVAECTPQSEKLMNMAGLKRIYLKESEGLIELQYRHPSLEFDMENGEPISSETAEHFMVCRLGKEISKNKITQAIIGLYDQYKEALPEQTFKNEFAVQNFRQYYSRLNKEMIERINNGGDLILLDKKEREDAEIDGVNIIHHLKAGM
jgi:GNAT superfamily N-acetyltransferase